MSSLFKDNPLRKYVLQTERGVIRSHMGITGLTPVSELRLPSEYLAKSCFFAKRVLPAHTGLLLWVVPAAVGGTWLAWPAITEKFKSNPFGLFGSDEKNKAK